MAKLHYRVSFWLVLQAEDDIEHIFGFCQSEYILRASSILEVIPMENKVKGTRYDVGNNSRYCWYCSDNCQYHCHSDQYYTDRNET